MAQLVAKITVENLPLYKDMAEFIVTVACIDDLGVPTPIRQRACDLALRIQKMLDALEHAEQTKEASDGE